ncbi:Ash1 GATA-like transcription factor [Candida orthopsilosis Co 90-125]|uniref:Ash1 GATA-like transcription factor n=1 Tax=Candida orthopsilosis (strain 90-125) TaxID=1136231 RepID=H8X4C5_CANO9|nr:Ash1 GATA-like transcription factor [Candida orthopsilosis Co 90-125]CCG26077.1 Ash1 GATA-like transcription factor [Candida orthopsilosis Co 90-125]
MSLVMSNHFNRFRSHSFEQNLPFKRSLEEDVETSNKRSKTAPPSPPSNVHSKVVIENIIRPKLPPTSLRSKSLSPKKQFVNLLSPSNSPSTSPLSSPENLKLPSINALKQNRPTPCSTVSSEFFDTCSDKSWRSELLDKIMKESKTYHLTKYNYLNNNCKPNFTSKLSSKISLETTATVDKKINFPFESNYTYLDGAFMTDVKNFPQYLKLANKPKSLVSPPTETPRTLQASAFTQPKTPTHQTDKLPSFHTLPSVGHPLSSHTTIFHPSSLEHYHNHRTSPPANTTHKFIIQSPKSSRSGLPKTPPRTHNHHQNSTRACISCGSQDSPCWRPSWSIKEGQLCNSCGLRYKKTSARCLNDACRKVPAKGEWALMQSKGKVTFEDGTDGYSCLDCGWKVEVK